MTTPQERESPGSKIGALPDQEIAGMTAYWAPALMRGLDNAVAMSREGDGLTERLENLYRQLVGDALREAFFRGASWGMAAASGVKYMLVDKETLARLNEEATLG